MALKDKQLRPDFKPDEALASEIRKVLQADGTVSCAAAMGVAKKEGAAPLAVGRTLDVIPIHLSLCQIGTFGYPGHAKGWEPSGASARPDPAGLEDSLQKAGGPEKRITCPAIWKIAADFGISRMQAGFAADRAGLKIIDCQLGAF